MDSYPITLYSTFTAANCQADLTRYFRFPCDGSTCIRDDLNELTIDCGGLNADEYAGAASTEDSLFVASKSLQGARLPDMRP